MKIYHQGEIGAYSHIASKILAKELNIGEDSIVGVENFTNVWDSIDKNSVGVIPIENSYAGSIHENMYNFLRYPYEVKGEINLPINHFLLSKGTDVKKIKKVYSHPQALSQCHDFLIKNNLEGIKHINTATSAKMVSESGDETIGAIASKEAGEIFKLNILKENIQDQNKNTTRFFIVGDKKNSINYPKHNKISLVFEARNIPASLYKCLGAFATNSINLSKIESMPNHKDPFLYLFWLDIEGNINEERVNNALNELSFFTKNYFIIGEY